MAFGLAWLEVDDRITFLEETPSIVFEQELDSIAIGIKAEFLGDKTKRNICLVTMPRKQVSIVRSKLAGRWGMVTYALHMLHSAARRSRSTNMSMRYAPILM